MSEELQESQKEAIQNNEIPDGVKVNEPVPVDDYTKENEQVKDKLAEFGAIDLQSFLQKVFSDSVYGKQVVRRLLGLDSEQPFVDVTQKSSPQEANVTGTLNHATFPPKLVGKEDEEVVTKEDEAAN
jgi:hypothetical protein